MAISFSSAVGATNSGTTVAMLTGPASGQRVVKGLIVHNRDTASVTVRLAYYDGSTEYKIFDFALAAGTSFVHSDPIVLQGATRVLRISLSGAPSTTQPSWYISYAEYTA